LLATKRLLQTTQDTGLLLWAHPAKPA